MREEKDARLHIFGQRKWHHNAYVFGNRKGLEALKAAIDEALAIGPPYPFGQTIGTAMVEPSDQETYTVAVIHDPDDCEDVDTAYWDTEVDGMSRNNSLVPNESWIMQVGAKLQRDRDARDAELAPHIPKSKKRKK